MAERLMDKNRRTLRKQIKHLVLFLTFSLSAVIVCLVIWNRINVHQNENMTDQFLLVDGYFESIDQSAADLSQYVNDLSEGSYRTILDTVSSCRKVTEEMAGMNIMEGRVRKAEDLKALTEAYGRAVEAFYEYVEENKTSAKDFSTMATYSDQYVEILRIHDYIMGERTPVYRAIQQNIRQQRSLWSRRDKIFFVELLFVCAVFIGLAVKRAASLSNSIVKPIDTLTEGAAKIAEGSLEQIHTLDYSAEEKNEIDFLIQVFNQMLDRISKQIEELQETEGIRRELLQQELETLRTKEKLKASELKRLQTQINSHFLFNTLSSITQTAYLENADKTVDLMKTTADFLRYSLDSTDRLVTLGRELEALGNYITLQEQRFGKRLRFYFDLQETCHHAMIPALTLQPVVENAIIHGIGGKKKGGTITVRTFWEKPGSRVCIQIEDDGFGMDEGGLEELRGILEKGEMPSEEIGLSNVLERLRLYYQDQAALSIESKQGRGTKVNILIPDKSLARPQGVPENGGGSDVSCNDCG